MDKKQIKFGLATMVIVMAIGYLMMTGISKTSVYYMTVSEFLEKKDTLYEEGVRLQGLVVDGTIERDAMALKLNFDISDEKKTSLTVSVNYEGIIPDLFEPGREVVIEGKYTKDEVFRATTLLTSCPSKYEESSEKEKSGKTNI